MVERGSRGAWAWAAASALLLAPGSARADGAFPDAFNILAPPDRPQEILLGTNFGLVDSEDGGRTWTWSCEQPITSFGRLYQMAPAPTHRLYAIAQGQLVYSDDGACGWQAAGGALADDLCEDAFVDPSDATRVLAAGLAQGGGVLYQVYASSDGGATFDDLVYAAAPGDLVTGIEIAASQPTTIYVALVHGAAGAPALARSTDSGATWTLIDLSAALGAGQIRIVAIDPTDADRVFLRVIGAAGDTLAIATDGGASVTSPLSFDGGLGAFVRTSAGTLLAFGTAGGAPALYRSRDGGASFAQVGGPPPPPILALAERAGTVYAATDTMRGPFAEATSTDEGSTWTPGLAFAQVAAIDPCVKDACQADCLRRAQQQQWPATVCAAAPPVVDPPDASPIDAGLPRDGDSVGLLTDASSTSFFVDAGDVAHPAMGCHCAAAPAGRPGWPSLLLLAAVAMVAARRGARRTARPR